jgi:hypothetical protein
MRNVFCVPVFNYKILEQEFYDDNIESIHSYETKRGETLVFSFPIIFNYLPDPIKNTMRLVGNVNGWVVYLATENPFYDISKNYKEFIEKV